MSIFSKLWSLIETVVGRSNHTLSIGYPLDWRDHKHMDWVFTSLILSEFGEFCSKGTVEHRDGYRILEFVFASKIKLDAAVSRLDKVNKMAGGSMKIRSRKWP